VASAFIIVTEEAVSGAAVSSSALAIAGLESAAGTPSAIAAVSKIFSDVPAGAWFEEAVQFVYDKGYFVGTGTNVFSPGADMTRSMFITVLGRIAEVDEGAYTTFSFEDVSQGDWFAGYTEWAYQSRIINGIGGNLFGFSQPVTREQMAVMIFNYAKNAGYAAESGTELNFADKGDVSAWAAPALHWMTENGLMQGKPGNRLDPKGRATRAEVATIAMRLVTSR
jgi:hypothetical protein